jgi:hypothetical protein
MPSRRCKQLRRITLLSYTTAMLTMLFATYSKAGESIWTHNGSKIRWVSDGTSRRAYYAEPRPNLERIGVHPGQLLFEGHRLDSMIEGRAFTFKPGCPPLSFQVSGKLSSETIFNLRGTAPRRDTGCDITSSVNTVLRFDYLATTVEGRSDAPGPKAGPGSSGPIVGPNGPASGSRD